jgi:hypothetical protein
MLAEQNNVSEEVMLESVLKYTLKLNEPEAEFPSFRILVVTDTESPGLPADGKEDPLEVGMRLMVGAAVIEIELNRCVLSLSLVSVIDEEVSAITPQ